MQFYAPQLFQIIGLGVSAALMASVVTNLVNMVSTFFAIGTVDRHVLCSDPSPSHNALCMVPAEPAVAAMLSGCHGCPHMRTN